MEHTSQISVDADPTTVSAVVADLSTYPLWNDVVASAEAIDNGSSETGETGNADDNGNTARPAWLTTLRARVGPFARSKQLRMVRSVHTVEDGTHVIRIERDEVDGRDHADWIMNARIEPSGDGSQVELGLEYSGGLWNPALELVLGAAIERAANNLSSFLDR